MEPINQYLDLFTFVCIRMQALKGNDYQVICFHPLPPAELVCDCESSFVDSKNEKVITISLLITLETNLMAEYSMVPHPVGSQCTNSSSHFPFCPCQMAQKNFF